MIRFVALLFLVFSTFVSAKASVVTDTVYTTDNDMIILNYTVTRSDNTYTIHFKDNVRRILGKVNSRRYKDLQKIAVVFFDKIGNNNQDVSFEGLEPKAFMIPSNVDYHHSSEGYFILQNEPSLTFKTSGKASIKLPLYLAYHPKKGKYTLFSKSNELKIGLAPSSSEKEQGSTRVSQQVVTSTAEIETDNAELLKVAESINLARRLIDETERLPFSESLADEIRFLRQQKRDISDQTIIAEVTEVLNAYEAKKMALEEKESASLRDQERWAEENARKQQEAIQAKNDSIAAVQKQQEEKRQSQNMWLIIGGAILAVMAFVGNQIFQHFRNIRNQRSMFDMQQSIASRAEAEAKRRARNAARNATNHVADEIRTKTRDSLKGKKTLPIKGKNKDLKI